MNAWVIIEIFGHQKFAGYLTECEVSGGKMLRLDVPESVCHAAFTKFFGVASIYSITPVDEEVARAVASDYRQSPVNAYDFGDEIREAMRIVRQKALTPPPNCVVVSAYDDNNTNESFEDGDNGFPEVNDDATETGPLDNTPF